MRKISVILIAILLFLAPLTMRGADGAEQGTVISCFDYFKPNSVLIHLSVQNRDLKPGDELRGVATLKNKTGQPIANGNLFLQVWRKDKIVGQEVLLDEFFTNDVIAINNDQEISVPFSWKIPIGISSGEYIVGGHFTINKKIYVSGVPFNDSSYYYDSLRVPPSFEIRSANPVSEAIILKDSFVINNSQVPSYGAPLQFSELTKNFSVSAKVKNFSSDAQEIKIKKKIYSWDNLREENLITENDGYETVTLRGKESKAISIDVSGLLPGAYLAEFVAESASGVKSVAKARFILNGPNPLSRIVYFGINHFPVKQGDDTSVFVCFQTMTADQPLKGSVELELLENSSRFSYVGDITKQLRGLRGEFTADKDLKTITLSSKIFDTQSGERGSTIDTQEIKYDCSLFASEVKEIVIELPVDGRGSQVKIYGLNSCEQKANTDISLEVLNSKGETVFIQKDYKGKELIVSVPFAPQDNHVVNVKVGEKMTSQKYYSAASDNNITIYLVVGVVFILILVVAAFILRRNNYQ